MGVPASQPGKGNELSEESLPTICSSLPTVGPFNGRAFRGIKGGHLEERMRNRTPQPPSRPRKTLGNQEHVNLVGRRRKACPRLFGHSQALPPSKMILYGLICQLGRPDPKEPLPESDRSPWLCKGLGNIVPSQRLKRQIDTRYVAIVFGSWEQ